MGGIWAIEAWKPTHVSAVSLNQLTNRLHASRIHCTQSMHIHRKVAYYDTYHANPVQCATQSMAFEETAFCSCFAIRSHY